MTGMPSVCALSVSTSTSIFRNAVAEYAHYGCRAPAACARPASSVSAARRQSRQSLPPARSSSMNSKPPDVPSPRIGGSPKPNTNAFAQLLKKPCCACASMESNCVSFDFRSSHGFNVAIIVATLELFVE